LKAGTVTKSTTIRVATVDTPGQLPAGSEWIRMWFPIAVSRGRHGSDIAPHHGGTPATAPGRGPAAWLAVAEAVQEAAEHAAFAGKRRGRRG
jgi:hypothetical protein